MFWEQRSAPLRRLHQELSRNEQACRLVAEKNLRVESSYAARLSVTMGRWSPASAVVNREIEPHSRLTSDESLLRGAVGVAGARLGVMEAHGTGQWGHGPSPAKAPRLSG